MIESLNQIDLELTPLTRQLLENFVTRMYEENADLSIDSLKEELNSLDKSGELKQLILAEALTGNKM
jgi:hypothetical protein